MKCKKIKVSFPSHHLMCVDLSVYWRKQLARDALEIHAPLAHRLGVHHLSGGLEDLAFKALYPNEYNEVQPARKLLKS